MIGHVLNMLWQDRRKYAGVVLEQVLIFIVLMVSLVSVSDAVKKYNDPGLLASKNRVVFGYMLFNWGNGLSDEEQRGVSKNMDVIVEYLKKEPYVESITGSYGFTPYMRWDSDYEYISDSIRVDGKSVRVVTKMVDEETEKVFEPELVEGTWLTEDALEDGSYPAVITRQLADKLGWEKAVGRKIITDHTFTVVGVISGVKQRVFSDSPAAIMIHDGFKHASLRYREFCAKIKPGAHDDFFLSLNREFKRFSLEEKAVLVYDAMEGLKKNTMIRVISNIGMQVVPTAFLMLFAFIGTFGLFWLNSKKRRTEFALRLVLGSTRRRLVKLVIMEGMILSVMATLPGILISFFIYEWTMVQGVAIAVTFFIMLLFSMFSAWYPAYLVSRLDPAETLRGE